MKLWPTVLCIHACTCMYKTPCTLYQSFATMHISQNITIKMKNNATIALFKFFWQFNKNLELFLAWSSKRVFFFIYMILIFFFRNFKMQGKKSQIWLFQKNTPCWEHFILEQDYSFIRKKSFGAIYDISILLWREWQELTKSSRVTVSIVVRLLWVIFCSPVTALFKN